MFIRLIKTLLLVVFLHLQATAQSVESLLSSLAKTNNATEKTDILNNIARIQLSLQQADKATGYAQQALALASKHNYAAGKSLSLLYLGKAYKANKQLSNSLNYYLQAAVGFEVLRNKTLQAVTYHDIGDLYQTWQAHEKAIEYYQKSYQLKPAPQLLMAQGKSYYLAKNYPKATETYQKALSIYQAKQDVEQSRQALTMLASIYTTTGQYQKALASNQQLLQLNQKSAQLGVLADTYNNIGVLHQKLEEPTKALAAFNQALPLYERLPSSVVYQRKKINLLTNIGTIYTQQRQFGNALNQYQKGVKISKAQQAPLKTAELYNYMAATYYVSRDNTNALSYAKEAVRLVKNQPTSVAGQQVLQNSYQVLAGIYQQNNHLKNYQKYYALHQSIKDSLNKAQNAEEQRILKEQLAIEKKENEFKMLLSEKEKQALSLQQLKLESEKKAKDLTLKAKELELLKRNQELQSAELKNQQLEKGKVEQLLALAEQKARTEQQKLLTEKQKRETERQKLLAEKQKIENLQKAKALEAAQKEKSLHEEQLKQEKTLRRYAIGLLISLGLLLVFVLFSFVASQKARKKLKKQNLEIQKQKEEISIAHVNLQQKTEEIASQNEELQQNQEEIMAQRDFIEVKNNDLKMTHHRLLQSEKVLRKAYDKLQESEQQVTDQNKKLQLVNSRINNSINVAQSIQNAILPHDQKMHKILRDHFILYRPKDVVSGDFYWIEQVGSKVFLVAADCTGHGVPGAMMSMIGYALLDKIVLIKKIYEPNKALDELHKEVKTALSQEQSGNENGMDLVMLCLEKNDQGQTKVTFCGAKNPLYYFEKGNDQVQLLKGDRRSIGGKQASNVHFTNQEIWLEEGSLLYLGSDGLVDQNNERRKSFGTKKLHKLLEACAQLEVDQQKRLMEHTLENQMQNTTQRDDILFLGVRL
ncbi:tetratricopeptide repeat protein [uncultured Microscilla sp.]|uniref:tetratricopeptide repeat protein n=1 Tax=uncultured Microscilla sp. TaxID=432653 RepID=UPI0026040F40|nr:tetratricopeptide repeat protein [uncultured Microscilla sp.]